MQSQRIRRGVANEEKNFNLFKNFSIRSAVTLKSLWIRCAFAIKLTETELRTHGDSGETLANARRLRAKHIKFKRLFCNKFAFKFTFKSSEFSAVNNVNVSMNQIQYV